MANSVRIVHCYIAARDGETVLHIDRFKNTRLNLTRYAIVPLEEFGDAKLAERIRAFLEESTPKFGTKQEG